MSNLKTRLDKIENQNKENNAVFYICPLCGLEVTSIENLWKDPDICRKHELAPPLKKGEKRKMVSWSGLLNDSRTKQ